MYQKAVVELFVSSSTLICYTAGSVSRERSIKSYTVIGYPSRQHGVILPAWDFLSVSYKKYFPESHVVNPLLTKAVGSR